MRRMVSGLMLLACLTLVSFSALAAGTTVTTFTPFADMDFAAQGYMDLITAWESETGNLVEDYSGLEDDVFMQQMQEMVASGRADIVVVPLGSGLAADKLVGVDELLAAAPDCGAKKDGRDGGKRRKRAAYAGSSELGEPVYQHRRAGSERRRRADEL